MKRLLLITGMICGTFLMSAHSAKAESGSESGRRCAVLLHGLGRTSHSMTKLEKALTENQFLVWNETYPSTEKPIEELSQVISKALRYCHDNQSEQIYFVTHSLGGILVRTFFQNHEDKNVRAIVMLAPPNHGSEVTDYLRETWWYQKALGPAGQQLGTGSQGFPSRLEPLRIPTGIIAGTESSDPWFSHLFRGPHDGKVSVESAKLPEMADFKTVPSGHTFIMNSDEVIRETLHFFESLSFYKKMN